MAKLLLILGALLLGAAWAMRRKLNTIPTAEKAQLPPNPDRANAMADAFHALTAPALAGTITDGVAGLTESRIGGPLAWPVGHDLPTDDKGTALAFLAQVDLATLPEPLDLPRTGLLQVLLAPNDHFGSDYPSVQGSGMRVVLHPAGTEFASHPGPQGPMPFARNHKTKDGHPITWRALASPPSSFDYQLSDFFLNVPPKDTEERNAVDAALDAVAIARGTYDILLQGNPDFSQSDPRENPQYAGLVNLIAFSSTGAAFMWGDCGEACFLIPPEDLAKGNLSRVIYYWDCC